jgi:RNA polymerase sigma factor (TIGR02999 family)
MSEPGDDRDVTGLLLAWSGGDAAALERLMPLVYGELRRIAAARLGREAHAETLQPTAVVHEAYLRLVDAARVPWEGRGHFFAVASRAMRQILVDHARARSAAKRGGGAPTLELADDPQDSGGPLPLIDVLALEEALTGLAADDPVAAQVVELRFYGGLTFEEVATVMGRSRSSVKRDWRAARAFLHQALGLG